MRNLIFLLFIFFSIERSSAQLQLHLPKNIRISTNDSSLSNIFLSDSLIDKVMHRELSYSIVGSYFDGNEVFTKIRLPQTYSRFQIIEQIILYYNLFDSEQKRMLEHLLIYPLFVSLSEKPYISCFYKGGGKFDVYFHKWNTVPVPPEPSTIEKEIYNQILDRTFSQPQSMNSIPKEFFREVANKNQINVKMVIEIYQKVLLWQKSH